MPGGGCWRTRRMVTFTYRTEWGSAVDISTSPASSRRTHWRATRIVAAPNLCVFRSVRWQPEIGAELRGRDASGCPRMPKTTLGVKWSQVQILSARRCQPDETSSRSEAVSEECGAASTHPSCGCTPTRTPTGRRFAGVRRCSLRPDRVENSW